MKRNQWHPLENTPELHYGQYVVPNFASNSVLLRNGERNYTVISPGKPLLEDWPNQWPRENAQLAILMPNHFHYMGVKNWQEAFPGASLYASTQAIPKLLSKGLKNIRAVEYARIPLPENYRIRIPPGHRGGDVWVTKITDDQRIWITCDSFQTYERFSNQPVARFLQKMLDTAPGLKMSQVVKWLLLNDRSEFKKWALNLLEMDQPNLLIPSHGEILQDPHFAREIHRLIQHRL